MIIYGAGIGLGPMVVVKMYDDDDDDDDDDDKKRDSVLVCVPDPATWYQESSTLCHECV